MRPSFIITKEENGFTVRAEGAPGYMVTQLWVFYTLEELTEFFAEQFKLTKYARPIPTQEEP